MCLAVPDDPHAWTCQIVCRRRRVDAPWRLNSDEAAMPARQPKLGKRLRAQLLQIARSMVMGAVVAEEMHGFPAACAVPIDAGCAVEACVGAVEQGKAVPMHAVPDGAVLVAAAEATVHSATTAIPDRHHRAVLHQPKATATTVQAAVAHCYWTKATNCSMKKRCYWPDAPNHQ